MSVRSRANTAAAASRHFRALGWRPLPSGTRLGTEGMRIQSRAGVVEVSFDYALDTIAARRAKQFADAAREDGTYEVDHTDGSTFVYLTRKEA